MERRRRRLNGNKISVTPTQKIEESLFATGFPSHNFDKLDNYLSILNMLMKNCHGVRRVGSAATDLALCGMW